MIVDLFVFLEEVFDFQGEFQFSFFLFKDQDVSDIFVFFYGQDVLIKFVILSFNFNQDNLIKIVIF